MRSTAAPLPFIRTLLELGADPNFYDHFGFPPLIAALSCSRSKPGSPARSDVLVILKMLLEFKADPNQRGINDYTALHMAVAETQPSCRAISAAGRSGLASTNARHQVRNRQLLGIAFLFDSRHDVADY